jgi:hypothetical protein
MSRCVPHLFIHSFSEYRSWNGTLTCAQVPADIIVLAMSDPDENCYRETKNLDGETNLKVRRAFCFGFFPTFGAGFFNSTCSERVVASLLLALLGRSWMR